MRMASTFPPPAPDARTATIRRTARPPAPDADWDDPAWAAAATLEVADFHPKSSDHRPRTRVRALHEPDGLHVAFRVEDRFVRCVRTQFQSSVCLDSCVEFFFWPRPDAGYFNFELNCGGTLLVHYYPDVAPPPPGQWRKGVHLPAESGRRVRISHSMPEVVEPEIAEPVTWSLRFFLPYEILEEQAGPVRPAPGGEWRGNFYKCGDETSHPHWAAWSPIGETLSFHQPARFGRLVFE